MKLIVGLGNPGEQYQNTRHNTGFAVIKKFHANNFNTFSWKEDRKIKAIICKVLTEDLLLVKPWSFMNTSGVPVRRIANFYKIPPKDIWVIHDDLDLKLGEYKIQYGIGPKVHGGINSIEEKLKSSEFWRVRVGVDNRETGNRTPGEEYVLQKYTVEELAVIDKVADEVATDLLEKVMK